MELRDIIENLKMYSSLRKRCQEFVHHSAESLLEHLLVLDFSYENQSEYFYFFEKNGLPSIRVIGRFINGIRISKQDKPAWERIRLSLMYDDLSQAQIGCIRTDEYGSHKTDHVQALTDDLAPYLDTIKSLKMIFTRTQHQETYDQFVRETLEESRRLMEEINELESYAEAIDCCLRRLFDDCRFNDDHEGGFFILPYNAVIRYKGYYHNCIGQDRFSVSLGYLKDPSRYYTIEEEQYHRDSYTSMNEANRYSDRPTIHHLRTLDTTVYSLSETIKVLEYIDRLFRDSFRDESVLYVPLNEIHDENRRRNPVRM